MGKRAAERIRDLASTASIAAAAMVMFGGGRAALALPQGMTVRGGQLTIQRPDGKTAVIRQGSKRGAADFKSFDIQSGERVSIEQPDAKAVFLGRVTGGKLTEIHGRLDANGRVLLINPAGVLVGPTGEVNTASFKASTLQVDPDKFMAGGVVELKALPGDDPNAAVINQGTIRVADAGFAALVAPHVVNDGVITARLGQVQMASGTAATLDVSGDGLVAVVLDPAVAGSISNRGQIQASHVRLGGGDAAALTAATVNLGGVIEARSAAEVLGLSPEAASEPASIEVRTAGAITLSGRVDASARKAGFSGGSVKLLGQSITLNAGAVVEASGPAGGGEVLVGGNYLGQGPEPNAKQVTIAPGAAIRADATQAGDGGSVVVWSTNTTEVGGTLRARGGAAAGDGGRIETSGLEQLGINQGAVVDARAPKGKAGDWLLDPKTITIVDGGSTAAGDLNLLADASNQEVALNVDASVINSAQANVTLAAFDSIAVNEAINMENDGVGLTLTGAPNATQVPSIVLDADITTKGGDLSLDGTQIILGSSVSLSTGSGGGSIAFSGKVDSAPGESNALNLTAGTGDIDFDGIVGGTADVGAVTINSATNVTADAAFEAASLRQVAGSGTTTFTGALATTAAAGVEVDGTNFDFNDTVTLALGDLDVDATGTVRFNGLVTTEDATDGKVTISNGGLLTITGSGDMNLAGAFLQDGSGTVSTSGDISTSNDNISFTTAATLTGNVQIDSGTSNFAVIFSSTVDSAPLEFNDLTVSTGVGDVTFDGSIGGSVDGFLGTLTINSGGVTSFAGDVNVQTLITDEPGSLDDDDDSSPPVTGGNAPQADIPSASDSSTPTILPGDVPPAQGESQNPATPSSDKLPAPPVISGIGSFTALFDLLKPSQALSMQIQSLFVTSSPGYAAQSSLIPFGGLPNGESSPFSFIPTIQLASLSSSSFDSSVQSDAFSPKSPAVVLYSFGASSLVVDQNLSTCLSANCGEGPSRSTDADFNGQGKGVIPADL